MRWPGEWLWPPRAAAGPGGLFHEARPAADPDRNAYMRYRARFELARLPESATLWLSADGRYLAFVNGHRIGRGPAASDADVREIDRHDVRHLLTRGANVVAVLVHSYGVDTAWYTRASTLAPRAGRHALHLGSTIDRLARRHWRWQRATSGWRARRGQRSLGFVEVRMPTRWVEDVPFDDTDGTSPHGAPSPTIRTDLLPSARAWCTATGGDRTAGELTAETEETPAPEPRRSSLACAGAAQYSPPAPPSHAGGRFSSVRRRTRGAAASRRHLVAARPRIEVDGGWRRAGHRDRESIDPGGRPSPSGCGGHRFICDGPQVPSADRSFRYLLVAPGTASPIRPFGQRALTGGSVAASGRVRLLGRVAHPDLGSRRTHAASHRDGPHLLRHRARAPAMDRRPAARRDLRDDRPDTARPSGAAADRGCGAVRCVPADVGARRLSRRRYDDPGLHAALDPLGRRVPRVVGRPRARRVALPIVLRRSARSSRTGTKRLLADVRTGTSSTAVLPDSRGTSEWPVPSRARCPARLSSRSPPGTPRGRTCGVPGACVPPSDACSPVTGFRDARRGLFPHERVRLLGGAVPSGGRSGRERSETVGACA